MGGLCGALELLSFPNNRVPLALPGSGIMGIMHRGVRSSQSYLCSCTARLCRRQDVIPGHSSSGGSTELCSRIHLAPCAASCTVVLSLVALLFASVPAMVTPPAFSLPASLKVSKNSYHYYYSLNITRGEHVCTLAHVEVRRQLPGVGSFNEGSRVEVRLSGSQGKHGYPLGRLCGFLLVSSRMCLQLPSLCGFCLLKASLEHLFASHENF